MKKIILFGTGKIAEVVYYYFSKRKDIKVCALTVDKKYLKKTAWTHLPIVPFEEIEDHFPPSEYEMFVSVGYQKLNQLRANRYLAAKNKGYALFSYIDPNAALPDDFKYGDNCLLMGNLNIQPCVSIGNNVFIWHGVTIGHHSKILDHCWVTGPSNIAGSVKIGRNSFLGINATIIDNICVGNHCLLGASVLITKSLPDESVVIDNGTLINRLKSSEFLTLSSRMGAGSV